MPKAPLEPHDLLLVAEWFAAQGLRAERFTEAEINARKTPDFRIFRGDEFAAFCEVKSPRDEWLDEQLEDAAAFEIRGGARVDPTFNRIARCVHTAVKQLDAVNPDRLWPNIVAFVNWADANHFGDLDETLTGYFRIAGGGKAPTNLKVAEGRIRDEKRRVDAYIWFNGKSRKPEGMFFSQSNPSHRDAICAWLDVDPSKIKD